MPLNVEWILAAPPRQCRQLRHDARQWSTTPKSTKAGCSCPVRTRRSGLALGLGKGAEPISDYKELKKGQKIGVMVGSFASMVLGKAGKSTSPYAFQSDMIEDLVKGELYGAAASCLEPELLHPQHPDAGLTLVNAFDNEPQLTWEVAVGLRKSDQAMVDAVNKVLDKLLEDGSIARIYAKYGLEQRLR